MYPVEVTLDGAGTFSALVSLNPGAFKELESSPWEYGRQLGQAVFTDTGLQRALAYARGKGECVSFSLQLDAPDLQDLLWERLILVSGGEELPFAASTTVSLSRRIPSETHALPPRQGPFRLLLMISSPDELANLPDSSPMKSLDFAAEIGGLRTAWDPLVQRGLMRVSILGRLPEPLAADLNKAGYRVFAQPATLETLADLLSSSDSLHLISHGVFKNDRATLLLETPEGRAASTTEDDFLAKFAERSLRLIFLQACQSATPSAGRAQRVERAGAQARRTGGRGHCDAGLRACRRCAALCPGVLRHAPQHRVCRPGGERRPANALSSRQPQLGDPGPLPCAEGGSPLAAGRGAARGAGPRRSVPREAGPGGPVSDRGDPPVAGHLLEDGDQPSGSARPCARSGKRCAVSGRGQKTLADRGHRRQLRPREDGAAVHALRVLREPDLARRRDAAVLRADERDRAVRRCPRADHRQGDLEDLRVLRDRPAHDAAGAAAPAAVPAVSRRRPGSGRPPARRRVRRAQADYREVPAGLGRRDPRRAGDWPAAGVASDRSRDRHPNPAGAVAVAHDGRAVPHRIRRQVSAAPHVDSGRQSVRPCGCPMAAREFDPPVESRVALQVGGHRPCGQRQPGRVDAAGRHPASGRRSARTDCLGAADAAEDPARRAAAV